MLSIFLNYIINHGVSQSNPSQGQHDCKSTHKTGLYCPSQEKWFQLVCFFCTSCTRLELHSRIDQRTTDSSFKAQLKKWLVSTQLCQHENGTVLNLSVWNFPSVCLLSGMSVVDYMSVVRSVCCHVCCQLSVCCQVSVCFQEVLLTVCLLSGVVDCLSVVDYMSVVSSLSVCC